MRINRSSTVPVPVEIETNFAMILLEQYSILYIHDLVFELVLPIAILWEEFS